MGTNTLVSCSSDKTIRVWKSQGAGRSDACLCGHTDYVTSLAASVSRPALASGGLRGEVFLWDLSALGALPTKIDGIKGSIYSLACDASGTIITAAGSAGSIYMIDARSGRREAEIRGHTGNVRAMRMRPDGGSLVSGGADHTLRVWDLRHCRAGHVLAVHTDSVWALAPADASHAAVLSGGRDGRVYRTNLSTRTSEVLLEETGPITALAPSSDGAALWVATSASTVNCWSLASASEAADDGVAAPQKRSGSSFMAGSLPAMRMRTTFEGGALHPHALQAAPVHSLLGAPAIKQAVVLTNRRHVLTLDSEDQVQLWDLTAGAPVQNLGKVSLKDAERDLFDPAQNVAPWFQTDTRLGCLAGTLEPPGCFSAEVYRRDLGESSAPADAKINMAEHMLKTLFSQWAEQRATRGAPLGAKAETPKPKVQPLHPGLSAKDSDGDEAMQEAADESGSPTATGAADDQRRVAFSLRTNPSPVIMVSGANGIPPWRCAADAMDGSELEGQAVPHWVADCVLRSKYPVARDLKMGFILAPAPGSGLPALLQSKLTAPRVLTVDKVADYVLRKMADHGVNLQEEPLFWSPEKQALWEAEHGAAKEEFHGGAQAKASNGKESTSGAGSSGGLTGALSFGIRQLRPVSSSNPPLPSNLPLLITCGGAVSQAFDLL